MANKVNSYPMKSGKTVEGAAYAIKEFMRASEKMDTQVLRMDNGAYVVQGRAVGGKWKQFVGMDKAISVQLNSNGGNILMVEIGNSKWIDKGLAMTVSMVVLWPLAVTSGIGMISQGKLPEKIFGSIKSYLDINY